LTPDEIHTLRRWIDAGLPWSHVAQPPATRPVTLRPIPAAYHPVLAIAIAPDGKRLAIARGDRAIIVDLAAEQSTVLAQCTTANEPVYALAWSPNGNLLAVGGYRHVRLWNLKSAAPVRSFDHLPGRITALAFTPDARTLLAADGEPAADGIVRQWSLDDPAASATWTAHRDSITSLRISADGARLVTASADKLVRIWDRAARKEIATLEGHSSPVMAVALNADATRLVSAGADREMKIWDTTTRQLVASLTSSPTGVADLCWLDEKRILSASDDGLVRLTSQDDKSRAQRTFTGAADVIYCLALSPDQKTVYAGCHDGKVYAWTLANGKLQRTIAPGTSAD
jgi:WD40 repeat protein